MTVWLTARGGGLAALTLLTITICAGALAHRLSPSGRVVAQYVHRATAMLGLGVVVLHVLTILADSYAHVGVTGALIPFTAGYDATTVGLGTIAAYLFVFASALGLAKARFAGSERGSRVWRRLHMSAYAAWAFAIWHGYFTGTDSSRGWVQLLYATCVAAVAASVITAIPARRTAARASPSTQPVRPGPDRELVNR